MNFHTQIIRFSHAQYGELYEILGLTNYKS